MAVSEVRFRWRLPEGWKSNAKTGAVGASYFCDTVIETDVIPTVPPESPTAFVELEFTSGDRRIPQVITVPFQWKNAVQYPKLKQDKDCPDLQLVLARMNMDRN
jgi:hypothetical protein